MYALTRPFGAPSPINLGKKERVFAAYSFFFSPSPFSNSSWERGSGGEGKESSQFIHILFSGVLLGMFYLGDDFLSERVFVALDIEVGL